MRERAVSEGVMWVRDRLHVEGLFVTKCCLQELRLTTLCVCVGLTKLCDKGVRVRGK